MSSVFEIIRLSALLHSNLSFLFASLCSLITNSDIVDTYYYFLILFERRGNLILFDYVL